MAILPALDEIQPEDDRPTLVILERPADKLPPDFVDWWNKQDLQNRVLVLTADPNAVATLRPQRPTNAGHPQGGGAPKGTAWPGDRRRWPSWTACGTGRLPTSPARCVETFKTIVFPMTKALRQVDDFRMEFERNDYSGEQQIVDTLTKRGKFIRADQFDGKFDKIRLDAEEFLFDADAVQQSSLRRNAAVRSGWFWLPRGGLEQFIRTSVQRGFWREKDGLVARSGSGSRG